MYSEKKCAKLMSLQILLNPVTTKYTFLRGGKEKNPEKNDCYQEYAANAIRERLYPQPFGPCLNLAALASGCYPFHSVIVVVSAMHYLGEMVGNGMHHVEKIVGDTMHYVGEMFGDTNNYALCRGNGG